MLRNIRRQTHSGRERATRSRSALSSPVFRLYFGASCFSTFAIWIIRFLLGWLTWDLTQSAFWVGVVSAAMLLPTFLLSPIFGVISDRVSARNGMLATTFLQAVIGAAAAIADMRGVFSISWLLVISACSGAVSSAHHPLRLALIPKLVRRESLPSAIGLSAMVFNSSRILGPAIGAWLVASASAAIAFWTTTALFACALLFLLTIAPIRKTEEQPRQSLVHDMRQGFNFVAASPAIKLVLTITMVNGLLGRSIIELLPAISGTLAGGGARALAILTAFAGVGSILGGLIISRQSSNERYMLNLIMLCLFASGVVLLPIVFVSALPLLTIIIMCLSMSMTMIGTGCQALIQLTVTDDYRGRVLSIWTVVSMGIPARRFCFGNGRRMDRLSDGAYGFCVERNCCGRTVRQPQSPFFETLTPDN